MPRLVTIVDSDIKGIRIGLWDSKNLGPYAFCVGKISSCRNVRTSCRFVRGINGIDIEILITALILDKQNVLTVARPEILAHRPRRVRRHRPRRVEWSTRFLDPHIHRVFVRLDERDVFAVRRYLSTGIFRITEKEFAIDQCRLLCHADSGENR